MKFGDFKVDYRPVSWYNAIGSANFEPDANKTDNR
jgi:hypothetical protein